MRSFHFLLTVLLLAAMGRATAQTAPTKPPEEHTESSMGAIPGVQVLVQQDVSYASVDGHPLLLDIYQPEENSSAAPAVVLIHGGGWISFDKSTMRSMGMFLARSGFVAFSVDYRLLHGTDNRWPAQLDDVQRAVRWIRANAVKYHVDADHIGAFGHSAGAQLAALLGMEDTRDNSDQALAKYSSKVQAVVDVSGPSDFTTNHDADGDAFLTAFFGGDYAGHAKVWQDASPVFHVSRADSPFLIVHGTQDSEVPIAQAQELADKLKQSGVPVKFVTVEDVHTFRLPEARKQLAIETLSFFMQYLRPGK
jgi:acetyl esterase/lipase